MKRVQSTTQAAQEAVGNVIETPKARLIAYALVRDADGKPVIDGDPRDLHPSIINAMTSEEFATACETFDSKKGLR